ncbi:MAG: hypothetical protein HKL95_01580 [Phycisphaerae bacterium]|nr:hypothetical protein [Phycisphaerae bacterium]
MAAPEVEEFAKRLVQQVRDAAIRNCDRMLQAGGSTSIGKRWQEASSRTPEQFAKVLIPDIVDETVANLLIAIDQGLLRLSFTASAGKSVDLTTVAMETGEMSGLYQGGDGWCEKYSKERYVNDVADLEHFFDVPPDDE